MAPPPPPPSVSLLGMRTRLPTCPLGIYFTDELDASASALPRHQRFTLRVASTTPPIAGAIRPQRIPRVIHHTNSRSDVPMHMWRNLQAIRRMNPTYRMEYYNNSRARDYVAARCGNDTLKAYDRIKPAAFKADLFRYCLLYTEGGVYLDTDLVMNAPAWQWIGPNDTFVSARDNGLAAIYQALLAVVPGHPVMQEALREATRNILIFRYGYSPLDITGPEMFFTSFTLFYPCLFSKISRCVDRVQNTEGVAITSFPNVSTIRLLSFLRNPSCAIGAIYVWPNTTYDNQTLVRIPTWRGEHVAFWSRYPEYVAEMFWYRPAQRVAYWEMWDNRDIFEDAHLAPRMDHQWGIGMGAGVHLGFLGGGTPGGGGEDGGGTTQQRGNAQRGGGGGAGLPVADPMMGKPAAQSLMKSIFRRRLK